MTSIADHLPSAASPLSLIDVDMVRVDGLIAQRLESHVPLVNQISRYIVAAGGKRLRPAILLMLCGALGYSGEQKYNLAAVVEFIHTATLLHDDVVDESTLRRGRATANESFGNAASVLVGDFLYSRAFQMMVDSDSMRVMQILSEATNVIAEGEVLQLMNMHDAGLTQEGYLRVIRSKTAKLFEASARIAAVLAASPPEIEEACATYGQALGTAFQVIDDALDYEGKAEEMGKNQGDDLREGKVTLPLIVAMQRANSEDAAFIRAAIEADQVSEDGLRLPEQDTSTTLHRITQIVQKTQALHATHLAASEEIKRAQAALSVLPESNYKTALIELAKMSLHRHA